LQEFRQTKGRTGERYWQIWFEAPPGKPPEIIGTAWGGIVDGHHVEHGRTKDRPGDKGKAGTKAWMSAADNATFQYDRQVRKKLEEGYTEVGLDGRPMIGGVTEVIEHALRLPKNLCFSKPRNRMDPEKLRKLEELDDVVFTRKVNGMMVIAHVMADGNVEIYSRRMDRLTDHFPHLARALGPAGMKFPSCSILLFEAFLHDGLHKNDLLAVQSVMRSKPDRAMELQSMETGLMRFYLFRIPVWKGLDLEKQNTCEEQVALIENTFTDKFIDWRDQFDPDERFLYTIEVFEGTVPEALAEAEGHGYEGWVCYQKSAVMGDYSYGFHGKPDRPGCCWKLKPFQEDDFIAYFDPEHSTKQRRLGEWGSGKNSARVGTLSLYQLNEKGEEVYICEVGSGMSDDERSMEPMPEPMVVEVKFEERSYRSDGDGSNALTFPRIVRFRDDKQPEECVNPQL